MQHVAVKELMACSWMYDTINSFYAALLIGGHVSNGAVHLTACPSVFHLATKSKTQTV